jgi:hypothetical protein
MNTDTLVQSEQPLFTIGVSDKDENPIAPRLGFSEPSSHEARHIDFDIHLNKRARKLTPSQMAFYHEVLQVDHALNELYPVTGDAAIDSVNESRFRSLFVRLFNLTQLVLEGDVEKTEGGAKVVNDTLPEEIAKAELLEIEQCLLRREAPRIKNRRVLTFLAWSGGFSATVLVIYWLIASTRVGEGLGRLGVDTLAAMNVMLLLFGTFVGVWIGYAIRLRRFSVSDLTQASDDYLAPATRLILAGTFAVVLALLAISGLGDIVLAGDIKLSNLGTERVPLLAFIIGVIVGTAEQKLWGQVEMKLGSLFKEPSLKMAQGSTSTSK